MGRENFSQPGEQENEGTRDKLEDRIAQIQEETEQRVRELNLSHKKDELRRFQDYLDELEADYKKAKATLDARDLGAEAASLNARLDQIYQPRIEKAKEDIERVSSELEKLS